MRKNYWTSILTFFGFVHVPSTNMQEAGFMIYTTANHQGAIKALWLHFWEAVTSSIFMFSLWSPHNGQGSEVRDAVSATSGSQRVWDRLIKRFINTDHNHLPFTPNSHYFSKTAFDHNSPKARILLLFCRYLVRSLRSRQWWEWWRQSRETPERTSPPLSETRPSARRGRSDNQSGWRGPPRSRALWSAWPFVSMVEKENGKYKRQSE